MGDGLVQARLNEFCDDGNSIDGDGCSSLCVVEICGDGTLHVGLGEQCDDGNITSGDGCSDLCVTEFCGDGTPQAGIGEQCDDGNTLNNDGCNSVCITEFCGDGTLQTGIGEQCDDGNTLTNDGCDNICVIEFCGDGILHTGIGEQCDDGNTLSNDGCNSVCITEFCGDGTLQTGIGEQCDDGNTLTNDGCDSTCVIEFCGDGILHTGIGEQCDDGNTDDSDSCPRTCQNATCGDGFTQAGTEQCDFGNGSWSSPYDAWVGPVELVSAETINIVVADVVAGPTTRIILLGHFGSASGNVGSELSATTSTPLSYTGYPIDIYTNGRKRGGSWNTGCAIIGSSASATSGTIECWRAHNVFGTGHAGPGAGVQAKEVNINLIGNGPGNLSYGACALKADDSVQCWVSTPGAMGGQMAQIRDNVPTGSFRTIALGQAFSHPPIACATPDESTLSGGNDGDISDGVNTPVCWGPGLGNYGSWTGDLNGKIFTDVLVGSRNMFCGIANNTGNATDGGIISCLFYNTLNLSPSGLATTQSAIDLDFGTEGPTNLCALIKGNTVGRKPGFVYKFQHRHKHF